MTPIIEPMTEGDVEAVARLRVATFFEGSARTADDDAAGLRLLLVGDGFETALVARVDDISVGTCLLVRRELEPAHDLTPWLAGLAVDGEHRGRGIGRGFYAGLGWVVVEPFEQDGHPMLLMAREVQL